MELVRDRGDKMQFKILLITANGRWLKTSEHDLEQVIVPIGHMYLSAYLKKQFAGQVNIQIIDFFVDINDYNVLIKRIQKFEPHLIGIRGMSIFEKEFIEISRIGKDFSNAFIVGGGPYITAEMDAALEKSYCNMVIYGEGELTLAELVDRLMKNKDIDNIRGTIIWKYGEIIVNGPRELIKDLDSLPIPDYDAINLNKYTEYLSYGYNKRLQGSIFTSRGCPCHCAFCHNIFGKSFRMRSPSHVLEEMVFLYDYGVRDFYIIDDNFNFNRKRAEEILRRIIDSKLGGNVKLYFPNGISTNNIDNDFIDLLYEAGTIWIGYAIETVSVKLQKIINKIIDIEKLKNAIIYSNEKGMIVNYWGMLGIPTETIDEANQLIDFMISLPPSCIPMLFELKPFPGTKMYESGYFSESEKESTDCSYQNFITLLRKNPEYISVLEKWNNHIQDEDRLIYVLDKFVHNGYRWDEIKSLQMTLNKNISEEKLHEMYWKVKNEG